MSHSESHEFCNAQVGPFTRKTLFLNIALLWHSYGTFVGTHNNNKKNIAIDLIHRLKAVTS
ncbi:hypothetical protein EA003_20060 [Vibrio anguillarum]|nr:hypothetical protein [Vibrio anguillarum]